MRVDVADVELAVTAVARRRARNPSRIQPPLQAGEPGDRVGQLGDRLCRICLGTLRHMEGSRRGLVDRRGVASMLALTSYSLRLSELFFAARRIEDLG